VNLPFNISVLAVPVWILVSLGFLTAFGITWFTIPSIVNISKLKNLCVMPNGRTSHTGSIPTLGGIAVFIGLSLSTVILAGAFFAYELKYIISGMLIVFFVGIKDDILIIDPLKKLAGQIFAIILISIFADIRITSLYGLFHVGNLPYAASILLTVFVFIVIINGFNLIDGIDGLAAGVGILTSTVFGIWFWMSGHIECTLLSFSFVGALASFFYFNVFSKRNKIFLGDTGSLLTGFVVGILTCRFLQIELDSQGIARIPSAPTVACGILIIPLFDSIRVFSLRVKQGKSPFKADRQHIHHRLLELNFTHLQATLTLLLVNLFFIVLSYSLRGIGIIWLMGVILVLASSLSYILVLCAKKRKIEELNSLIAGYFVMKTTKDRTTRIGVKEKQNEKVVIMSSNKKVGVMVS
jgi:UDP-GlcNAc:undecaprenyl-phosphate/decaprenyl-phosphate GlcNAc-1-phosphate transferase